MKKREIFIAMICLTFGLTLTILGAVKTLDAFWSGMGSALLVVGSIRLFRSYRVGKNDAYREMAEDERFRTVHNKAWAWAGFLFVIISALCTIIFRALGQDLLSIASGVALGLMVLLYWVCFFILKKKKKKQPAK